MSKKRNTTTPLLLILLLILGFSWIKPKYDEVNTKQESLANLRNELAQTTTQINLDSPIINLTATQRELLDSAIPQGFDQESILNTIQNIADQNRISNLSNISFQRSNAESTQQIKAIQITINAQTNLLNLQGFIEDLENNNRFFNIKSFSTSLNTLDERTEANFSIQIESYYS